MMTRHPCHAGARASTWPCVPRRVHVGPRAKSFFNYFLFFNNIFIILKQLKSKINQIKFRKIPEKFYKFVKIIAFKI